MLYIRQSAILSQQDSDLDRLVKAWFMFDENGQAVTFSHIILSFLKPARYTHKTGKSANIKPASGNYRRRAYKLMLSTLFGSPAVPLGPVTLRHRIAPVLLLSENKFIIYIILTQDYSKISHNSSSQVLRFTMDDIQTNFKKAALK